MRELTLAFAAVLFAVSARDEEGRKPHYLTAAVGESTVLNCEVDFPHDVPVPYILRWNKGGSAVFAWNGASQVETAGSYAGRVSRIVGGGSINLGRGAINLTSIRESDEGWYECQVFYPNRNPPTRSNGTWFHLTVEGGKLLAIPPINQTVTEGGSAQFRCVAKQVGARVSWWRDGVPLASIPTLWARSEVDAEGSLTIKRTEHDDPGLFRCEVANDAGEKQAAGAHLNVLYKAKVVLAPAEQFLAYGRHGLLDCHFRANPPLTYLRWEKDGFLFDPYNVPGVFLLHNGSLAFDHVDETHAGVYTCTPFNELGSAGASAPMTVLVQRPPVFTLRPASLYVRRAGDAVDMACAAMEEGNPEESRPPKITWLRKDGGPLPTSRHQVSSGNLTLRVLRREDAGVYICEAANEAARIVTEAELLVEEGAPRAPHSLAANSSHDAIALRWTPGARRPAQHISVWYRRADMAEWRSLRLPAGAKEAVLSPLRPGSLYEVMVASREQDGEGMLSRPLRIHTKGMEVQEEASEQHDAATSPHNISVQALGSSWLVTWSAPERGHGRGYTVRWMQQQLYDEDDADVRGVDTDDTWLLVRGLEEGATYVFEVESREGGGSSRTSVQVTGQRARSARAVVLAALVAAILLVAVAVASWHGGRACNNRDTRRPSDPSDRKIYDALVSRLQPPSLAENVWVAAPNTLSSSGRTSGYPRENYD